MDTTQLEEAIYGIFDRFNLTFSNHVVDMLIETACAESCCGKYLHQINGPACGIFQIEPNTARDIVSNYIQYRPEYKEVYNQLFIKSLDLRQNLIYNLAFQIFICRLFYQRIKEPIPHNRTLRASYWKKYYNTAKGKGTIKGYLEKVSKYDTRECI